MPSKKSRRVRDRKTVLAKPHRTRARTKVASARAAIAADPAADETGAAVRDAVKALASAAHKGVIHKNNASRRASRIMKARAKANAS